MIEHTFLGTWEIVSCTFEGRREISGLEGIKFRLDDTNDITWYNDLVSPLPEARDCNICCDLANVLFNCETFDVQEANPRLIFGAFDGHSIEFYTNTLTPKDTLVLECENWYAVECKRLRDCQAAGQEQQFSLGDALQETYFSDVVVKSASGLEYAVHASILRLNGFDCSMYGNAPAASELHKIKPYYNRGATLNPTCIPAPSPQCDFKPGTVDSSLDAFRVHNFSSSYNSLKTTPQNGNDSADEQHSYCGKIDRGCSGGSDVLLSVNGVGVRHCPPTSHSDSHLETSQSHCKNIFNFCQDLLVHQAPEMLGNVSGTTGCLGLALGATPTCGMRRPPLSPYRARSPSPLPTSIDTPPSSPLTPVGMLCNLPTLLLNPILHWLYTESLLPELEDDVCEKLIDFAESQPSLTKLLEPTRKYLQLMRLKKFVVNVTMDLHGILNRIIQCINPINVAHEPALLYGTFQEALREVAIGCAKVLQFCNIFIKDATNMTRYQKNEIIKYVRTRVPIFMSQIQQLLCNMLEVFVGLSTEEKSKLIDYLVPEIESTLLILTAVIEEIKISLETMCKNVKSPHLDRQLHHNIDHLHDSNLINEATSTDKLNVDSCVEVSDPGGCLLSDQPVLLTQTCCAPPLDLTMYEHVSNKHRFNSTENDIKFVMCMYEVRKMRDIYGRIAAALEVIKDKKSTFCEMDFPSKCSTINQNLEQLIVDIPAYIFIVEKLSDRVDNKLNWKEFKFCFKLATSQINAVIVQLLDRKSALSNAINQICKMVHKHQFTESLIELGLLENKLDMADHENNLSCLNINTLVLERPYDYDYKNIRLNLIRHLCEPPIAANSCLSKNALRLLHSAQLTDMEFEVQTYVSTTQNALDTNEAESNSSTRTVGLQVHSFKAHRVIVAARCEWFKKALMSGMQESINKKVVITDTSPVIFRRLLLYLYGAPIDRTVGAEEICELMLLADRYSLDDLKEICENTLNSLIDEDSVVCLLGIADRYMATALKSNCLSFLSQHAKLTKGEIFKELPQSLQLEVLDLIHWFGRVSEPWNDCNFKSQSTSRHSLKSSSKQRARSRKSSPSCIRR